MKMMPAVALLLALAPAAPAPANEDDAQEDASGRFWLRTKGVEA